MTAVMPVVSVPIAGGVSPQASGALNTAGTGVVTGNTQLIAGQLAGLLQNQAEGDLFQNILENVGQNVTGQLGNVGQNITGNLENVDHLLNNLSSNPLVQNTGNLQNLSTLDLASNLENLDIGLTSEVVSGLDNVSIETGIKEFSTFGDLAEAVEAILPEEKVLLENIDNITPQFIDINKIFDFEKNNIPFEDVNKILQQTFNEIKPELSDEIFNNLADDMKRMVVEENGNIKIATILQNAEEIAPSTNFKELISDIDSQQDITKQQNSTDSELNTDQGDVMSDLKEATTGLEEVLVESEENTTGNFVSQLLENQDKGAGKHESRRSELDKIDAQDKMLAHNAAMKYRDVQGLSVADQIKIQIRQAIDSGDSQIKIHLHPKELGSLNIQLDLSKINGNQISIAADKLSTLNLLQNDVKNLQRSLSEVGVKTDDLNLTMNFSQQNNGEQQQRFDQQELYKNYSFNINREIAQIENIVAMNNNILYNPEYNSLGINIMA